MRKPSKRTLVIAGVALVVVLVLASAFRSPPVLVDSAEVTRGPFRVTVEDEGRTRVKNRYEVLAPVNGYMSRVWLEPGDPVEQGDALVSIQAAELDPRARAQAQANLARAEAAIEAARSQVESEQARVELAGKELQRLDQLVQDGFTSEEVRDRARAEMRRANAALNSARFAVDVALHERDGARAALASVKDDSPLQITAPVTGVVLNRLRQSEGAVQMGEPILTIGDTSSLEVEVDLLSPDAVRLRPGMRVELERWGGEEMLPGRVQRIEPAGFTKYSALGVEEQRVWVIVDITVDHERWQELGDAYRVEARFILWEGEDVLQVPASALFREGEQWAAYVIQDNTAVRRNLMPGRRSGLLVEIKNGLQSGETVVLHPGDELAPDARVEAR